MNNIRLSDVRLSSHGLDAFPRLRRLRKRLLNRRPEMCIERARHITEFMRDLSDDADPIQTRYAAAVHHYLAHREPVFPDDNLLAGSTTSKALGVPIYPEFTGLAVWPELHTIAQRRRRPIKLSRADAEVLNRDVFPYWMGRTVLERARDRLGNPPCMRLFERLVFFIAGKAGCVSHTVPHYATAVDQGLDHVLDTIATRTAEIRSRARLAEAERQKLVFYDAARIALEGIIAYAANLSRAAAARAEREPDPWRRENLLDMARVCAHVPAKPARTFREAVNALWLLQVGVLAENNNMAISPGRLDQILYKAYRRDVDQGILSVPQAMELVGCLWLKFNDNAILTPRTAEELFGGAGPVAAVTLGGIDEDGQDAVNDLTYIMLRVAELLKTREPNLNARYHGEKNPNAYRDRVAEVVAETKAVPALYNDKLIIDVLKNQGVATAHARDYAVIGCVEITAAGRSYDASSSIMLNLSAVMELTLYNGRRPVTGDDVIGPRTGDPARFRSMADFWRAFEAQYAWLAGQAVELNEALGRVHQEVVPSPLLSALFVGPLASGKDLIQGGALYNSSGATHIGFADTVDSLTAIDRAVFEDRVCSFPELLAALQADFRGHEALHTYLVNHAPKYGTADALALKYSRRLVQYIYRFFQGHTNYRGGTYRPAYWTMTSHTGQGKFCGALPNGRRAGKPLASGITPVAQMAADLTTCCRAVGELNAMHIPGGAALNLKYPRICRETDAARLGQTIEAYFQLGGLQVQFNVMSYDALLDAKQNPSEYPNLLVRVSGYSAYFNDLNDAMKDEIITRTEYDMRTGKAVPFPHEAEPLLPAATS